MSMIRWRALGPLAVFGVIFWLLWFLFADRVVHHTVEDVGSEFVGARVDLDAADIRLADGEVLLRGLQVTNPQSPMQNLLQADEIVVMVDPLALLEQKVIIDTLALRGLAFGTARETSGALDASSTAAGQRGATVAAWMEAARVPPLSLEGLGDVTGLTAFDPSRLRTAEAANLLEARADSIRSDWEGRLAALDPQPLIDSVRSLITELEGLRPNPLTLVRSRRQIESARTVLGSIGPRRDGIAALHQTATSLAPELRRGMDEVLALREADYAYARGLLQLPSLDSPDLSAPLLGDYAAEKAAPLVYWANLVGEYLPPGLDPRRRPGPDRARRAGTTVVFPRDTHYPALLIGFAEATMSLAGRGAASGDYALRLQGLTTEPAVYGRPMLISASRMAEGAGPSAVQLAGVLDHRRQPARDSVGLIVNGLSLSEITIAPIGVTLIPGIGDLVVDFQRTGDAIDASWTVRSDQATFIRTGSPPAPESLEIGSAAWMEHMFFQALSGLREVEIQIGLSGSLSSPALSITSNLGRVVAEQVTQVLGDQVRRLETRVRAEVDERVGNAMTGAQARVGGVTGPLASQIGAQSVEMDALSDELERAINEAARRILGGIRVPGIR